MRPAVAILLWLLLTPLAVLAVALVLLLVPLPPPFPPAGSAARNLPAAICTGTAGLLFLAVFAAWVVRAFRRAGRVLEPFLSGMGFDAEGYLFWGRRYSGHCRGRAVVVRYLPGKAPGPGLLEVEVAGEFYAKAAVGRSRPLLDLRDQPLVGLDAYGLEGLVAVSSDAGWLAGFLGRSEAVAALGALFPAASRPFREVYLKPGGLWYRHHPRGEAAEELPQILDAMLNLAEAADRV